MNVNPDALRKETVQALRVIDGEVLRHETEARRADVSPFDLRDVSGNAPYVSLITAKLVALNTLALLNEPSKKR